MKEDYELPKGLITLEVCDPNLFFRNHQMVTSGSFGAFARKGAELPDGWRIGPAPTCSLNLN